MGRVTPNLMILIAVVALGRPAIGVSQETTVTNTFQAGTPAKASEVNENFSALVDAINANSTAISDGLGTDAATILDLSVLPVVIDVPVYQYENCYPMIPAGGCNHEMILGDPPDLKKPQPTGKKKKGPDKDTVLTA